MNYNIALVQLPLVREPGMQKILAPADAWRACSDIGALAQESMHVLCLNARNRLINRHMVSLGLADASLTHPREVFRPAVSDGASAVILVHNHPSGDLAPSAEDLRVTRQLVEAGEGHGHRRPRPRHRRAGGGQSRRPACQPVPVDAGGRAVRLRIGRRMKG